jgi:hypothetical protein
MQPTVFNGFRQPRPSIYPLTTSDECERVFNFVGNVSDWFRFCAVARVVGRSKAVASTPRISILFMAKHSRFIAVGNARPNPVWTCTYRKCAPYGVKVNLDAPFSYFAYSENELCDKGAKVC